MRAVEDSIRGSAETDCSAESVDDWNSKTPRHRIRRSTSVRKLCYEKLRCLGSSDNRERETVYLARQGNRSGSLTRYRRNCRVWFTILIGRKFSDSLAAVSSSRLATARNTDWKVLLLVFPRGRYYDWRDVAVNEEIYWRYLSPEMLLKACWSSKILSIVIYYIMYVRSSKTNNFHAWVRVYHTLSFLVFHKIDFY